VTFASTDLPAGLSISTSGLITGTAASTGVTAANVTATDSTGATATGVITITVA
jgi:hypothetical protein